MTPQVRLCRLARSDRDEFVAAMGASRGLHGRWSSPPTTAESFDALLERRSADESGELLLVRRREDDALVGYYDLSQITRGPFQNAFLGYAGVAAHNGQGYMAAGMRLLLRHAFAELRLHRLEANIQPGNAASIALVRRAGFVKEGFSERYLKISGRWRDHERWAIRAEQWRGRRSR
ncbi:MAG TPA: GNAT family protein [Solirubrobacterales bacterium]|nr:GNAT family protein [Solirubrobacterales bacterium]